MKKFSKQLLHHQTTLQNHAIHHLVVRMRYAPNEMVPVPVHVCPTTTVIHTVVVVLNVFPITIAHVTKRV